MNRDRGWLRPPGPIATLAFIGSAAVLAVVAAVTPARAGKQRNAEGAREHTQRATIAYNLGHFDEAVEEFEAAYKLVLDPALLFNIAQADRLGGHPERALATYKAYLRTGPRSPGNRKQAEKWRDELERARADAPAGDARSAAASASPADRAPAPFAPPPTRPAAPASPSPATTTSAPTSTLSAGPVAAASATPGQPAVAAASATRGQPAVAAASATPGQPAVAAAGATPGQPAVAAASATPGQPAGVAFERTGDRPEGATGPSPGLSILEIELGPRFLSRSFDYTASATSPPGYRLSFTPVVGGMLSLFPAARATGLFAHLGLLAAVEAATWMSSGIFPTGTSDAVVGVQGRVPATFGQISASVAYFRHAFLLQDTPDPHDQSRLALEFPNTTYVGARFGLGGRFNLGGRVVLGLDAGYRWVVNPGQGAGLVRSTEYFPGANVSYALDAGASFGVRFSWCQVRVGVDHRRYVFGVLRGATLNAPGATDAYTALWLSVMGEFGAANRP